MRVSPALHDTLLPRLCGSGRFVWLLNNAMPVEEGRADGLGRRSRRGSSGWPSSPTMRVGNGRSRASLFRGDQAVPLSDAVLLLANGLVLFPQTLARLDAATISLGFPRCANIPTIDVPYADRGELLEYLCAGLRDCRVVDLPANLKLEQVHPEPQGKLSIRRRNGTATTGTLYRQRVVPVRRMVVRR